MVGTVQQFISTNPVVKDWHSTISRKRTSTADLYAQSLHTYWVSSVKLNGFGNINNWMTEVKGQRQSNDVKERRQWATDLLNWFDTYKSPRTKRPLTTDTRNVFVAAIKGFLVHHIESANFVVVNGSVTGSLSYALFRCGEVHVSVSSTGTSSIDMSGSAGIKSP